MVQHVLVEQVRLVEQEDRVHALFAELFDVRADGVEDACRGCGGREAERDAELPIEIAATEGCVVAVGEAKAVR